MNTCKDALEDAFGRSERVKLADDGGISNLVQKWINAFNARNDARSNKLHSTTLLAVVARALINETYSS